jgi:hypothetical protein
MKEAPYAAIAKSERSGACGLMERRETTKWPMRTLPKRLVKAHIARVNLTRVRTTSSGIAV